MIDTLIDLARAVRIALYRLSSARILGIDVDLVLHFGLGAIVFAWSERRFGARRAAWILAGLILAKEIVDLFLKSKLRYITRPTVPALLDIATDVASGAAGGLAVWLLLRRARRRLTA